MIFKTLLLYSILLTTCTQVLYPDLVTIKPLQLTYQFLNEKEFLRFTNSIGNIGKGIFAVQSYRPLSQMNSPYAMATQLIFGDNGEVLERHNAGYFEYHLGHKHWHLGKVAHYEIRKGLDDGFEAKWSDQLGNETMVSKGKLSKMVFL
jgi:hypothetical protein